MVDVRQVENRPSTLELNGKPASVSEFMPLVLIKPEVKSAGEPTDGPEGCLSFPEIFADTSRPETVDVVALNEQAGVSNSAAAVCWRAQFSTRWII